MLWLSTLFCRKPFPNNQKILCTIQPMAWIIVDDVEFNCNASRNSDWISNICMHNIPKCHSKWWSSRSDKRCIRMAICWANTWCPRLILDRLTWSLRIHPLSRYGLNPIRTIETTDKPGINRNNSNIRICRRICSNESLCWVYNFQWKFSTHSTNIKKTDSHTFRLNVHRQYPWQWHRLDYNHLPRFMLFNYLRAIEKPPGEKRTHRKLMKETRGAFEWNFTLKKIQFAANNSDEWNIFEVQRCRNPFDRLIKEKELQRRRPNTKERKGRIEWRHTQKMKTIAEWVAFRLGMKNIM